LVEQAEAVRGTLEQLEDLYFTRDDDGLPVIGKASYLNRRAVLTGKLTALETRLSDIRGARLTVSVPTDADALAALWDAETLDWQRALIDATTHGFNVLSAPSTPGLRRFSPERIVPR
jgi:hypothetical protein